MVFCKIFKRLHRSLALKAGTVRALALSGVRLMLLNFNGVQRAVIFNFSVMLALANITADATVDFLVSLHGKSSFG